MDAGLCRPAVLGPAILIVGLFLHHLLRPFRLPDIPIVGAKPAEWFTFLRARWRNLRDPKAACNLAYTKYRKQACIMPITSARNFVHLPLDELQWLFDELDHSANALELTKETLELPLTVIDPKLMQKPGHKSLVSTLLTRETGNLILAPYDEIEHSVSELWGAQPGETRRCASSLPCSASLTGQPTVSLSVSPFAAMTPSWITALHLRRIFRWPRRF